MPRVVFSTHLFGISIALMLILFAIFGSSCTDLERRGYSPIPQNAPATWETSPYGDMRN